MVDTRNFILFFFLCTLGSVYDLNATTDTWTGGTNNLSSSSNWSPALPGSGDKAIFTNGASSFAPTLPSGSFSVQLIDFISNAPQYAFDINGSFYFSGTTFGLQEGVLSASPATQSIELTNGLIELSGNASAWLSGNSGSIDYSIGTPFTGSTTTMLFIDSSTAGEASITGLSTAGNVSQIEFFDMSNAGNADITLLGTSAYINFYDTTGAGTADISISSHALGHFHNQSSAQSSTLQIGSTNPSTQGSLEFSDSSTAANATISVVGENVLVFSGAATAGNAQITIGENTYLTSGLLYFQNASSAARSTINIIQHSVLYFENTTSAAASTINLGDDNDPGYCYLSDNTDAGSAHITVVNDSQIFFTDVSNAKNASISIDNGLCAFENILSSGPAHSGAGVASITASNNGEIVFSGLTTAQSARIQVGTITPGVTAATLDFHDKSTAATSSLYAVGESVITFHEDSQAGQSMIFLGEDVGGNFATAGLVQFVDSSSAGTSAISANQDSLIVFDDNATAYGSSINLNHTSSLIFYADSTANNALITIGDSASANFIQTGVDLFSGVFVGGGEINKSGSGTLTISSNNGGFSGTTTVTGGKLALNGILGSNVFVQNTGILSGIGTVTGNLTISGNGKISPGNSIGTLHVNGNYTQSDSIYQVQVDGVGGASLINVLGEASLGAGAEVNVISLSIPSGEVFTVPILHADLGLFGTFSGLTSANPLVAAELTYDLNNAYLTYENALSVNANTYNEQQVANQLITITNPTAEELAVLNALVGLPAKEQSKALDQISAQQYATLLISGEETTRSFIRRLYDPLRPLITGALCPCECSIDTWETGSWERGSYGGNRNANGFDRTGYELSFGVQASIHPEWVVGAALMYEQDFFDYNVGGSGISDTGLGAIYALYRPQCFYVLGDLVLGGSRQNMRRPIAIAPFYFSKRADPVLFQSALYVESGIDCWWNCMLFQPFFGLEFGYCRHGSFEERSCDPFLSVSVEHKTRSNVSSRLGCHCSGEWFSCLSLAIDAAWQCRMTSLNHSITESFVSFGDSFKIKGIPMGRNSIDGVVNLSYKVTNSWLIYAEAMGQRWRNDSSYSLIGGIGCTW